MLMNLRNRLARSFLAALDLRNIRATVIDKPQFDSLASENICIFHLKNREDFYLWKDVIIAYGSQGNRIVLIVSDISVVVEDIDYVEIIITEPTEKKEIDELLDTLYKLDPKGLEAKLNVLLLEENPVSLQVSGKILESLGYNVLALHDSEKALTSLAENNYDVILMDTSMSGGQAEELARKVRKLEVKTPIIALSSFGVEVPANELEVSCMNGFLRKPLEKDDLADEINRVVFGIEAAYPTTVTQYKGVFFPDELVRLIGLNKELLCSLLSSFMEDTEQKLFHLDVIKKRNDKEALIRIYHSLAGASKNLRAPDFGNKCSILEKTYKGEIQTEVSVDIIEREMRNIYIETRKEMKDFLHSL